MTFLFLSNRFNSFALFSLLFIFYSFAGSSSMHLTYLQDVTPIIFNGHSEQLSINYSAQNNVQYQIIAWHLQNDSYCNLAEIGYAWKHFKLQLGACVQHSKNYSPFFLPGISILLGNEDRTSLFIRIYHSFGKVLIDNISSKLIIGPPVFHFIALTNNAPLLGSFYISNVSLQNNALLPTTQKASCIQAGFESDYFKPCSFSLLLGYASCSDLPGINGVWDEQYSLFTRETIYTTYSIGMGYQANSFLFNGMGTLYGSRFEKPTVMGGTLQLTYFINLSK